MSNTGTIGSPGTVSRILWHFTGGPRWDTRSNRQTDKPKPAREAYESLKAIARSKKLRLGGYKEVVSVVVPEVRVYDKQSRKHVIHKDVLRQIESSQVCCLADIPVIHLAYHAERYGKFAIGFHRESAISHGFNPVLYTLDTTAIVNSIYRGLSAVQAISTDNIEFAASTIDSAASDVEDSDVGWDIQSEAADITMEAEDISMRQDEAQESVEDLLAFIKTFHRREMDAIYCEREWRSVKEFNFTADDIAMVVLPKSLKGRDYFTEFCSIASRSLRLPRTIPVLPWEDLIEH